MLEQMALAPDGMTFGDIAELLQGVPSSTISRLLKVMIEEDLIAKEDGSRTYRMGRRAGRLGRAICGTCTIEDALRPVVDRLAMETDESAAYYEMVEDYFTILVKHEPANGFHYINPQDSNRRFRRNTFGKLCLAHVGNERVVEQTVAEMEPMEAQSFRKLLVDWRSKAVVVDEHAVHKRRQKLVTRVVAPVFTSGEFCGTIGITANGSFDNEFSQLAVAAVETAAREAGKRLSRIKQQQKAAR